MKIVSSEYLQNMLSTQIVVFVCFDIQNNFGTQHVLQMLRASEKDLPVSLIRKGLHSKNPNIFTFESWSV